MLEILPDADALARRAAHLFAWPPKRRPRARGAFTVALSGGETPARAYQASGAAAVRRKVPWRRGAPLLGDERCVPPEDARSNYGMARRRFHQACVCPGGQCAPSARRGRAGAAARAYEKVLLEPPHGRKVESAHAGVRPVLVGLGADGHTASLFPHTAALAEETRLVVPNEARGPPGLTVTLPSCNALAACVSGHGREKAGMVAEVIGSLRIARRHPGPGGGADAGVLTWFLDAAAAAELSTTSSARDDRRHPGSARGPRAAAAA